MSPKLLDLCCSGGGAGMGYQLAGFDVTGVDLVRRSCGYPCGELIIADALEVLADEAFVSGFDAVHASFPCQLFSRTQHLRDAQGKGTTVQDLLTPGLPMLRRLGIPYVVENVPDATKAGMRADLMLCGSMFPELAVYDDTGRRWLQRHRIFESNVTLLAPGPCNHRDAGVRPLGVYGSMRDNIPSGGQTCTSPEQGAKLMGMPWAADNWRVLTEAIPPAYAAHVGAQLMSALDLAAVGP